MTRLVVVDLDGTLFPGNSFHRWMKFLAVHLARRGRLLSLARLTVAAALRRTSLIDHAAMKRAVLQISSLVPDHDVAAFGQALATELRPDLVDRIRVRRGEGRTVVLATAAPELYLAPVALAAGVDDYIGSPPLADSPWRELVGRAKLDRLEQRFGSDVQLDEVYTDHSDDLPLVLRASRVVAINPSPSTWQLLRKVGPHVTFAPPRGPLDPVPHGVGALMVTYNSSGVAPRAIRALLAGDRAPEVIVVVDNGSDDTAYLDQIAHEHPSVRVILAGRNLGFCAANNLGLRHVGARHLLLVNPDAFVSRDFIHRAAQVLESDGSVGAVQPKLLGADAVTGQPTGLLDSVGIEQTRAGRLFDRGQGKRDDGTYDGTGLVEPEALCAATMLVRYEALLSVTSDRQLFDESFFMYKEDIDLSWRLRRAGWRIAVDTSVATLHCRGWHHDRRAMPSWARHRSLANEWRLWWRGWSPGTSRWRVLGYLAIKTLVVWAGR